MDKDISLGVLKCRKNEAVSDPDSISNNKDTVPEEENENDQVDEDEDNKGVVSIRLKVYLTCFHFCLDVMLYLHKELDEKSLQDKITHIWTDWSRKDNKFKKTRNSKGSAAKDIFFLIVRYNKHCEVLVSCSGQKIQKFEPFMNLS